MDRFFFLILVACHTVLTVSIRTLFTKWEEYICFEQKGKRILFTRDIISFGKLRDLKALLVLSESVSLCPRFEQNIQ